jgi:hypothetical protein
MSAYTEEEAKTKFCPQVMAGGMAWEKCAARECMAWRWMPDEIDPITGHSFSVVTGYCGLAGRPE